MRLDDMHLDKKWKAILSEEFSASYMSSIFTKLEDDRNNGKVIYPPSDLIFNAFNACPFDKLKVVIIGQDPYHGPNQAMGLSFSVPKTERIPPSLKNIYKELATDISYEIPVHGDLTAWAQQGVFLLNAVLTVEHKSPGSHKKLGWQTFTDAVNQKISKQKKNVVFLLWGNYAKGKKELIDTSKHLVLEAPHPSPLARGGFFGCKHFSKTNNYLTEHNKDAIDWQL